MRLVKFENGARSRKCIFRTSTNVEGKVMFDVFIQDHEGVQIAAFFTDETVENVTTLRDVLSDSIDEAEERAKRTVALGGFHAYQRGNRTYMIGGEYDVSDIDKRSDDTLLAWSHVVIEDGKTIKNDWS